MLNYTFFLKTVSVLIFKRFVRRWTYTRVMSSPEFAAKAWEESLKMFSQELATLVRDGDVNKFADQLVVIEKNHKAVHDREGILWKASHVYGHQLDKVQKQFEVGVTIEDDLLTILQFAPKQVYMSFMVKEIAETLKMKYTHKTENLVLLKSLEERIGIVPGSGQVVADGAAGGSVVINIKSAEEAVPVEAGNGMQAMIEAKAKLDASLAECEKALEEYKKASRLFDEAVSADNDSRKRRRA